MFLETSNSRCLPTQTEETSKLWHSRLGDVNYQAMMVMSKQKMAHGMPEIVQQKEACTRCLLLKQTRQPFPYQANFRAKQVLELIHRDLCGPIAPSTKGGKKYFLL